MGSKEKHPLSSPVVLIITLAIVGASLLFSKNSLAHCDTLDGPVVKDARLALEKQDVTGVLKWIRPEDEEEIRRAFDQVQSVRPLGREARNLADRYFFETLVRVHRQAEGAPYTGLKPAGRIDPAVARADHALEMGQIEPSLREIQEQTAREIRERFSRAAEDYRSRDRSVAAGRRFVHSYVAYVHFIEDLATLIHNERGHGAKNPEGHLH